MRTITPFTKGYFGDVLRSQNEKLKNKIHSEETDYILNVNEDEYVDHLVSEFSIDPPILDVENKFITHEEKMVPADRHPRESFFIIDNKSFPRQVIKYHIPFSGEIEVISFKPSTSLLWTIELEHEINDEGEFLCFELINFTNDAEKIKRDSEQNLSNLQKQFGNLANEVNNYNTSLLEEIRRLLRERKEGLKSTNSFLDQLEVPVKKRDNVPSTFSVPAPKAKKKIIPRPALRSSGTPDPTLDIETYNAILNVIHDMGKQIERMPAVYTGKDEEGLRDHFLIILETNFEGSATGETFNKSGKTDILLRHDGNNIFVAECKFWAGEKKFIETIDQILKYLTWRDSKASIMVFVRNADFTNVTTTAREAAKRHSNFISLENEEAEGTIQRFRFHLNGDIGRELLLTVLLFHFP
ncbi:hypothetical protein HY389_02065 [Candidatus Daviesbacteria bacterium]|nr:hypothetical protein [Candidatus Daviesbacteria bacterium]